MTSRESLNWKLFAASIAMLIALGTYLFARVYPPAILAPLSATNISPVDALAFWDWAPSFLYSFSLCLLIGCVVQTSKLATQHCVIWILLTLILEISQYPSLATQIVKSFENIVPETGWIVLAPYWVNGTFDPLDILATVAGGGLSLTIIIFLQRGKVSDSN